MHLEACAFGVEDACGFLARGAAAAEAREPERKSTVAAAKCGDHGSTDDVGEFAQRFLGLNIGDVTWLGAENAGGKVLAPMSRQWLCARRSGLRAVQHFLRWDR